MNEENFKKFLIQLNIDEKTLEKYEQFYHILKEENKKINLTRIITKEDVYLKHFYDCLYVLNTNKITKKSYICDVGSGAGFPGIVLAIALPDSKIELIESNTKKAQFLQKVKKLLELNNVEIINERAEKYAKLNREKYDIVVSRAVAKLRILSELCIPLLKVGGYFISFKGKIDEEYNESKEILKNLSSTLEQKIEYKLPVENSNRVLLVINKNKQTNKKYPRNYSTIVKSKK